MKTPLIQVQYCSGIYLPELDLHLDPHGSRSRAFVSHAHSDHVGRHDWRERFAGLQAVIVDEWHESLPSNRGVQVQLAIARLRTLQQPMSIWGLSATLSSPQQALEVLLGPDNKETQRTIITAATKKKTKLQTLIPDSMERFPWAGHLGLKQLPKVIEKIESKPSTLLFTNTRSQSELWYHAMLATRPDWESSVALHHGSIVRRERRLRANCVRGYCGVWSAPAVWIWALIFRRSSK